ncbi:MAG: formate/nitrite transporter family protein [Chloroflexi bacterium]|nr:formate/nitrite transporter family protein [Chloroflexota bacterium]
MSTQQLENGRPPATAPGLTAAEERDVEHLTALRPPVVHEIILKQGDDELARPPVALAWSGLAAGLSMGFSLVAEGLTRSYLPDAPWRPLIEKMGYTVGFLIVILARQQLFTENTLTVILPLMARRDQKTLVAVLRLWSIVLAANLTGAALFAWAAAGTGVFDAPVHRAFTEIGLESMRWSFGIVVLKGIFAGWLIALMVWMLPAADAGRVPVLLILTYLVGLGSFTHIVAGSTEVFYLACTRELSWTAVILGYSLPALVGNIIGGVSLVAALNHAQVVAGGGSGKQ